MQGEFKQCPNGHYYQGESCPYCKTGNNNEGASTSLKTEVFAGGEGGDSQLIGQLPTETQGFYGDESKTTLLIGGQKPAVSDVVPPSNRTVFGDETEIIEMPGGKKVEKKTYRSSRKLVGWLVTYSFDAMGVDYKLYEGRNTMGHDVDCNITVNDPMMSGKHATILFQENVYFLKDEFSTHGTFVNDVKMYPNSSQEIKDGDIIRLGKTTFKFRIAL